MSCPTEALVTGTPYTHNSLLILFCSLLAKLVLFSVFFSPVIIWVIIKNVPITEKFCFYNSIYLSEELKDS